MNGLCLACSICLLVSFVRSGFTDLGWMDRCHIFMERLLTVGINTFDVQYNNWTTRLVSSLFLHNHQSDPQVLLPKMDFHTQVNGIRNK